MKNNKFFTIMLIVTLFCVPLLPVVCYGSEIAAPGYWQWVKDYVAESRIGKWWTSADLVGRKRLQAVTSGGWTGFKRGALIGSAVGGAYGLSRANVSREDYMLSFAIAGLGALAYNVIREAFNAYNNGSLSEAQVVVEQIKQVIKNRLLKADGADEKKFELLTKINKELDTLINKAFEELKKEIGTTGSV